MPIDAQLTEVRDTLRSAVAIQRVDAAPAHAGEPAALSRDERDVVAAGQAFAREVVWLPREGHAYRARHDGPAQEGAQFGVVLPARERQFRGFSQFAESSGPRHAWSPSG